jgi:hypothetical protein
MEIWFTCRVPHRLQIEIRSITFLVIFFLPPVIEPGRPGIGMAGVVFHFSMVPLWISRSVMLVKGEYARIDSTEEALSLL